VWPIALLRASASHLGAGATAVDHPISAVEPQKRVDIHRGVARVRARANCPNSHLGEDRRRRVDVGGRHHARPDVPRDQQGRACLGDGMSPKVLWDVVRAAAVRAGIDKLAPRRSAAHVRSSVPPRGGELDQNPVSARPRLHPDDRALSRMQTEAPNRRERPIGNRT